VSSANEKAATELILS